MPRADELETRAMGHQQLLSSQIHWQRRCIRSILWRLSQVCASSCYQSYLKSKLSKLNRRQVEREINIHSSLNHPHIVDFYAAFEDDARIYLVMEYAAGGDLFDEVKRLGGRIGERQVVQQVMYPYLCALIYLHRHSIVHRDIKPENTVFTKGMVMKITDFGLACNSQEERPVTRLGTLDYMAPEVLCCPDKHNPNDNKDRVDLTYDKSVDAWAMGVLAYELVVGRPPFSMSCRESTMVAITSSYPTFPDWMSPAVKSFIQSATTIPPARFARATASAIGKPAPIMTAIVAITVSPAPETSNTSRAMVAINGCFMMDTHSGRQHLDFPTAAHPHTPTPTHFHPLPTPHNSSLSMPTHLSQTPQNNQSCHPQARAVASQAGDIGLCGAGGRGGVPFGTSDIQQAHHTGLDRASKAAGDALLLSQLHAQANRTNPCTPHPSATLDTCSNATHNAFIAGGGGGERQSSASNDRDSNNSAHNSSMPNGSDGTAPTQDSQQTTALASGTEASMGSQTLLWHQLWQQQQLAVEDSMEDCSNLAARLLSSQQEEGMYKRHLEDLKSVWEEGGGSGSRNRNHQGRPAGRSHSSKGPTKRRTPDMHDVDSGRHPHLHTHLHAPLLDSSQQAQQQYTQQYPKQQYLQQQQQQVQGQSQMQQAPWDGAFGPATSILTLASMGRQGCAEFALGLSSSGSAGGRHLSGGGTSLLDLGIDLRSPAVAPTVTSSLSLLLAGYSQTGRRLSRLGSSNGQHPDSSILAATHSNSSTHNNSGGGGSSGGHSSPTGLSSSQQPQQQPQQQCVPPTRLTPGGSQAGTTPSRLSKMKRVDNQGDIGGTSPSSPSLFLQRSAPSGSLRMVDQWGQDRGDGSCSAQQQQQQQQQPYRDTFSSVGHGHGGHSSSPGAQTVGFDLLQQQQLQPQQQQPASLDHYNHNHQHHHQQQQMRPTNSNPNHPPPQQQQYSSPRHGLPCRLLQQQHQLPSHPSPANGSSFTNFLLASFHIHPSQLMASHPLPDSSPSSAVGTPLARTPTLTPAGSMNISTYLDDLSLAIPIPTANPTTSGPNGHAPPAPDPPNLPHPSRTQSGPATRTVWTPAARPPTGHSGNPARLRSVRHVHTDNSSASQIPCHLGGLVPLSQQQQQQQQQQLQQQQQQQQQVDLPFAPGFGPPRSLSLTSSNEPPQQQHLYHSPAALESSFIHGAEGRAVEQQQQQQQQHPWQQDMRTSGGSPRVAPQPPSRLGLRCSSGGGITSVHAGDSDDWEWGQGYAAMEVGIEERGQVPPQTISPREEGSRWSL
ncbi:MAG: hypothetical protein WDW38_009569 [Sanguina aurantia]